MPNPALDTVIDLVQVATQLEFEHSVIEEPGWNIDAIRLNTSQIESRVWRKSTRMEDCIAVIFFSRRIVFIIKLANWRAFVLLGCRKKE